MVAYSTVQYSKQLIILVQMASHLTKSDGKWCHHFHALEKSGNKIVSRGKECVKISHLHKMRSQNGVIVLLTPYEVITTTSIAI